jgi:hypothetical protein
MMLFQDLFQQMPYGLGAAPQFEAALMPTRTIQARPGDELDPRALLMLLRQAGGAIAGNPKSASPGMSPPTPTAAFGALSPGFSSLGSSAPLGGSPQTAPDKMAAALKALMSQSAALSNSPAYQSPPEPARMLASTGGPGALSKNSFLPDARATVEKLQGASGDSDNALRGASDGAELLSEAGTDADQPSNIATNFASRDECIDRCYHLLERPLWKFGSDINTNAFHRCVNRCLGNE